MKAHLTGVTVLRVQLNMYFVAMALWTPSALIAAPSGNEFEFIGRMYESHIRHCHSIPRTKSTFFMAFQHLFRFSEAVLTRSLEMYEELGFDSSQEYIALHARLGGSADGASDVIDWQDPERHDMSDLPVFFRCAKSKNFEQPQKHSEDIPMLLISDSSKFKKASEQVSGASYVKSTMLFHVDRSTRENLTLMAKGNIDTYSELLLLSRATCIVGSHSGFSGVAAAISDVNGSRCFCLFDDCSNDDFDYFESVERVKVRFLSR